MLLRRIWLFLVLTLCASFNYAFAIEIDHDRDGLFEYIELGLGWHDNNRDSDGNGVIDGAQYGNNVVVSTDVLAPKNMRGRSKNSEISDDNSWVVYQSDKHYMAPNLGLPGRVDIYRTHLLTGLTDFVSVNGEAKGCEDAAILPDISADGRYVVFQARCRRGFSSQLFNSDYQIYVKDMLTGDLELISKDLYGHAAIGHSSSPAISANGRYVTFVSGARGLVDVSVTTHFSDIYLYDRLIEKMTLVTQSQFGNRRGHARNPQFSGDAKSIVFSSSSEDLNYTPTTGVSDIYKYSLASGTVLSITVDAAAVYPSASFDGSTITYSAWRNVDVYSRDVNNKLDAYLYDANLDYSVVVSLDLDGRSVFKHSIAGAVSKSGRYALFRSQVRSIVNEPLPREGLRETTGSLPTNQDFLAFILDRSTGQVSLLIKPTSPNISRPFIEDIDISPNGTVIFHALSGNEHWSSGNDNRDFDVYITKTGYVDD